MAKSSRKARAVESNSPEPTVGDAPTPLQLTVTIAAKGALDPVVARIDDGAPSAQALLMVPNGDKTVWIGRAFANVGDHWLTWFLLGATGTAYTITLEGPQAGPWTSNHLQTVAPGRDSGVQDFAVGAA